MHPSGLFSGDAVEEPEARRTPASLLRTLGYFTTRYDWHQAHDEQIEQTGPEALLDDVGSHQGHVLASRGRPCLLDRTLDAIGDEGVGRITRRHRFGRPMGHDEERDAWDRSAPAPRAGHFVGATPSNHRAQPADVRIKELRADGGHPEGRVEPAWSVAVAVPIEESGAADPQWLLRAVVRARDETIDRC